MHKSDHIDLNLIDLDKLDLVLDFESYFSDDQQIFYSASRKGDTPYDYAPQVNAFIKALYEANLIQPFNWVSWKETERGQQLFSNPNQVPQQSLEDLIKMMIVYLRSERFIGGQLKEAIDNGFFLSLIHRIKSYFNLSLV